MKRTFITAGLLAMTTLAFGVGCSKDKKEEGAAGEAAAPGEAGKPAVSAYAVFPADSEFVFSFSLEGLRKSPMWAKFAPMVQAKIDEEMKEVKEACGIDPMTKFSSVIVGGKPNDEKNMVIVVKGFTKAELTTCGQAMAKKEGKQLTITEEDGITKIHDGGENKDLHVAWLDDTTAVMSPNPDKAWVKARAAGQSGLDGNAAFMTLLKNVDTSATIYMTLLPTPGSELDLSKNIPGAKGAFGSLKVTEGLGIDGGLNFDTADNAKKAQEMASSSLQQAKAMMPPPVQTVIDKAKFSVNNTDLVLQLTMTQGDIEAISQALAPMLGGMMGGMAK